MAEGTYIYDNLHNPHIGDLASMWRALVEIVVILGLQREFRSKHAGGQRGRARWRRGINAFLYQAPMHNQ